MRKFKAPTDPLQQEERIKAIEPPDKYADEQLIRMAMDYAQKQDTAEARAAAGMLLAQVKGKQFRSEIGSDFARGFIKFLLGKQDKAQARRTPWGNQPLTGDSEVCAYIDMLASRRHFFKLQLELLRNRVPKGIHQAYVFYKFFVLQNDEPDYLKDWDVLMKAFDDADEQPPFDPKHPYWPRPFYPFTSDDPSGLGGGGGPQLPPDDPPPERDAEPHVRAPPVPVDDEEDAQPMAVEEEGGNAVREAMEQQQQILNEQLQENRRMREAMEQMLATQQQERALQAETVQRAQEQTAQMQQLLLEQAREDQVQSMDTDDDELKIIEEVFEEFEWEEFEEWVDSGTPTAYHERVSEAEERVLQALGEINRRLLQMENEKAARVRGKAGDKVPVKLLEAPTVKRKGGDETMQDAKKSKKSEDEPPAPPAKKSRSGRATPKRKSTEPESKKRKTPAPSDPNEEGKRAVPKPSKRALSTLERMAVKLTDNDPLMGNLAGGSGGVAKTLGRRAAQLPRAKRGVLLNAIKESEDVSEDEKAAVIESFMAMLKTVREEARERKAAAERRKRAKGKEEDDE